MHSAELYWRNRNMVATQDWVQGGTEHQDHAGELKVHRYSWAPLEIKGCRYMPIERVHRHPNKYTWSICKLLNSQHSIHFICACIVRRTPLENIPKVMQTWETVAAVWYLIRNPRAALRQEAAFAPRALASLPHSAWQGNLCPSLEQINFLSCFWEKQRL